jgi:hypothetical protein
MVDATFDSYHFLSRDVLTLKFVIPYIIIQFKSINQLDAKISQVYYLTFIYRSTCFGRRHARNMLSGK